jgi:hypothetical protein
MPGVITVLSAPAPAPALASAPAPASALVIQTGPIVPAFVDPSSVSAVISAPVPIGPALIPTTFIRRDIALLPGQYLKARDLDNLLAAQAETRHFCKLDGFSKLTYQRGHIKEDYIMLLSAHQG